MKRQRQVEIMVSRKLRIERETGLKVSFDDNSLLLDNGEDIKCLDISFIYNGKCCFYDVDMKDLISYIKKLVWL